VSNERLAEYILWLQDRRCHKVNFVTPTHSILPTMRGIYIAAKEGIATSNCLPQWRLRFGRLVTLAGWNHCYLHAGCKPRTPKRTRLLSKRKIAGWRFRIDPRTGLADQGLLARHVVLPGDYGGTLDWRISSPTQYEARDSKKYGLNRKPSIDELQTAHSARSAGPHRILY
jgi:hypothetical protein